MIRIVTLIALVVTAILASHATSHAGGGTYVIDGDTIVVNGETIRIKGIDTPEKGEPCAEAATALLREMLAASGGQATVTGRSGTDTYGRTVASVKVGGKDVGRAMLSRGLAVRYNGGNKAVSGKACQNPEEYDEYGVPLWTAAALAAIAASNDIGVDLFNLPDFDFNYRRAAKALYLIIADRNVKAAEWARAVERDRNSQQSSSSGTNGNTNKAPNRCYAPGGRTWTPCG